MCHADSSSITWNRTSGRFAVLLSSLVLTLLLGACATTPSGKARSAGQPDWVDGRSSEYPDEQYLIGVGHAGARQTAEERAYAAVARIFEAKIEQFSKDFESYVQRSNADDGRPQQQLSLEQLTTVATKKAVENVRLAETWFNPADGLTYVLAVLNRQQAAAALRQRISSLDLEIDESLRTAQEANSRLQVVRGLHRALTRLLWREAYNADLRVVSLHGRGMPTQQSIEEVRGALEDYMARHFKVAVEVQGDAPQEVRAYLMEGLTREGFHVLSAVGGEPQVVSRSNRANIVARVQVRLHEADLQNPPWKHVRWQANFSLYDVQAGQTFGSLNRGGREGHLSLAEARHRALRALQKEVLHDLSARLVTFVYGNQE